jgi:hypothetical protein
MGLFIGSQNKLATLAVGVKPVEYYYANSADGAGSDANSDCHGEIFKLVQVFIADLSVRSRFLARLKTYLLVGEKNVGLPLPGW